MGNGEKLKKSDEYKEQYQEEKEELEQEFAGDGFVDKLGSSYYQQTTID